VAKAAMPLPGAAAAAGAWALGGWTPPHMCPPPASLGERCDFHQQQQQQQQ
jgi:hypothetical protein